MTLDLNTVPQALVYRILKALQVAGMYIQNGTIYAEEDDEAAEEAMEELSAAERELNALFQPTTPGANLENRCYYTKTYPVFRNGALINVPRQALTPSELEATIIRLKWGAQTATLHAEDLRTGRTSL